MNPTARQIDFLNAIQSYWDLHGYAPTVREIGGVLRLTSTNSVHQMLCRLRNGGLVTWNPSISRALRLTAAGLTAIGRLSVSAQLYHARAELRCI